MIVWATVQGGFIGINLFQLLFSVSGHPKIQKLQCPKKQKNLAVKRLSGQKSKVEKVPQHRRRQSSRILTYQWPV